MTPHQAEIARILRSHGCVSLNAHPHLASSARWEVACGRLLRILPAVFIDPAGCRDPLIQACAAGAWAPDSVITGFAAAKVSFWPRAPLEVVTLAMPHGRPSRPGFEVERRTVPPEYVLQRRGFRITAPALTVLDLVARTGRGEAIDQALRVGAVTLATLYETLAALPHRRGNRVRTEMLLDSRDQPWSEAERRTHRLLRAAGITGWKTNVSVCPDRSRFFVDILFKRLRVAVEIDGYEFHSDREVFETDRVRQNALVLDGWLVLRYTWQMIIDEPERIIAEIRTALTTAELARQ